MNRRALFCALAIVPFVGAGCGGGGTPASTELPPTTTAATTTAPQPTMTLTVFRFEGGTLRAEAVEVPKTTATAAAALKALGHPASVTIAHGTATVDLPDATDTQIEEIVYTLTQFPTVQRVTIAGKTVDRAVYEPGLPPIFVESPASGARIGKSFHVQGTASVFEATLVVELVQEGKVVVKQSVTAAEGAPGRGAFDTTLTAPAAGAGKVVAFAPSAQDGSPQHQVEVPVTVVATP